MITIESRKNKIILFGRNQDGSPYTIEDTSFVPYFYIEDWKGQHKTIDGKRATKVICHTPGDIKEESKKYPVTYEADVRYVNRYIIDKMNKLEQEPIKICYIDIEIARTEEGYESPDKASNPILMIGCKDNFTKERKRFVLKDYNNEKQLLKDFTKYLQASNPDLLIAWNGDAFDFKFIINRMKVLGLEPGDLARAGGYASADEYGGKIFGRVLFDLMLAYKKMNPGGRESWSLDYISKYELGDKGGKEKYKGELDDLYRDDINKFISYNDRDVDLLELLNDKLRIVEYFDTVRRLCYCKIEDIFMNTRIADCLCLNYAKGKYVLPSKKDNNDEKIVGAFVRDNEPKLYEDVAVMDMKSLYPSVMIGFNISYETVMPAKTENCISIDDKYFFKKEKGIIPAIVKPLLDKRKEIAKQMEKEKNEHGQESQEYKTLWMTQYSLKVVANSIYGALLEKNFRLHNRDAGQAITYIAQKIIKEVHTWFEGRGLKVIYGDTDSCFLLMEGKTINDMIELNREINKYFKSYFTQYGVDEENNIFKLEFEKVFKTVLFKERAGGQGAKKRYAGRLIWNDGKEVDKVHVVGFEVVRSDYPSAGRIFLKGVLKMILYQTPKEEIYKFVEDFKDKIRSGEMPVEELAFPVGIQNKLEEYGNEMHARAARLANERHKAGIKQGDKIKFIFVKDTPGGVIAFKNYMYDGYSLNYDKLVRRIVDMKVGPLFKVLGWEYKYLELEKKKKVKREKTFEEKLVQMGLW